MPSFNITKTAVDSKISVSRNPALIRDWKPICSIWLTRKWENMKKQKNVVFMKELKIEKILMILKIFNLEKIIYLSMMYFHIEQLI